MKPAVVFILLAMLLSATQCLADQFSLLHDHPKGGLLGQAIERHFAARYSRDIVRILMADREEWKVADDFRYRVVSKTFDIRLAANGELVSVKLTDPIAFPPTVRYSAKTHVAAIVRKYLSEFQSQIVVLSLTRVYSFDKSQSIVRYVTAQLMDSGAMLIPDFQERIVVDHRTGLVVEWTRPSKVSDYRTPEEPKVRLSPFAIRQIAIDEYRRLGAKGELHVFEESYSYHPLLRLNIAPIPVRNRVRPVADQFACARVALVNNLDFSKTLSFVIDANTGQLFWTTNFDLSLIIGSIPDWFSRTKPELVKWRVSGKRPTTFPFRLLTVDQRSKRLSFIRPMRLESEANSVLDGWLSSDGNYFRCETRRGVEVFEIYKLSFGI